jgi:hypothetical protein
MSLTPGARLGPYEIVVALAAGGMGEVYRARDHRLQRDVAIKVLPELFASDPDRRARFEREAQAVAALSHPNILAIFDVGVHDRTAYAVTELLDGETLRDRLTQGALPLRKVVEYAVQIARGLAAAHDKGIVHRDLKPENLFILNDGRVKILDFGIARPMVTDAGLTITGPTDPGTVMGTVGYMAPEQVRGQAVDQRTDLFAFGAVLYEMLSGRRAFQRDTAAETMTAILREDPPDITDVRAPLPPGLERIVRHCLEKSPSERFQSARDVAFAIEALSGTATGNAQVVDGGRRPLRRWLWPVAAAAVAMVGVPAAFMAGSRGTAGTPVMDVSSDVKTFEPLFISNARFMPDGETIVYSAAAVGNVPALYVSRPHTAMPQPLGYDATHLLSISSTGELAVLTNTSFINQRLYRGTLARMTIDGAPRPWMNDVREADWAPDGKDIAVVRVAGATDRLEYPSGHTLFHATGYLSDPRVSPDGRRVAFFDHPGRWDDRGVLKVVDRDGNVTPLTHEFWGLEGLAWTPDGSAVVLSGAFGGEAGYQVRIAPASPGVADRQLLPGLGSLMMQDIARNGRLIVLRLDDHISIRARSGTMSGEREFAWLNSALEPHLSPDERLLVFSDESESAGPTYSVAYRTMDGGPVARLGEGNAYATSPDGKWVLSQVPAVPERLVLYPLGPGAPVQLDRGPIAHYTGGRSWMPDSRHVVVCGTDGRSAPRCYRQAIDGPPEPLTPAGYSHASVAPDGRTVLLSDVEDAWHRLTISTSTIEPLPVLKGEDNVISWSGDSRSVYVQSAGSSAPAHVDRIDLLSGTRTRVRDITLPDPAGIATLNLTEYRDDGAYAYWYWKRPARLFVVSGVRITN